MTTDPEKVPLPTLPHELRELTGGPVPPYGRNYRDVLDGRFPAHRDGSRWYVRRSDLPVIAAFYGLAAAPSRAVA